MCVALASSRMSVICMYIVCFGCSYFLEKNMLVFFIKYLEQKSGQYISVQLLQTLNILFENISNETSTCKF